MRGALLSRLLVLSLRRFRIAGLLAESQPLGIYGIHEDVKAIGIVPDDPMVSHVLA